MSPFSLKQLLLFVFAICVYLATVPIIFRIREAAFHPSAPAAAFLIVLWAVLALVYHFRHLKGAIIVHGLAPLLVFLLCMHAGARGPSFDVVSGICLISILFSFPIALLSSA